MSKFADIYMVRSDRQPDLVTQLTYEDGTPVDLTSSTVTITVRERMGTAVLVQGATCTILDAAKGSISYRWGANDLQNQGDYWVEFRVQYPGTLVMTAPTPAPMLMTVRDRLG